MNKIVQKDILSILSGVKGILEIEEEKDVAEIKKLSNHIIHDSSIFQDEDSISIAILVYSLSKIIERKQGNLNYKPIRDLISKSIDYLDKSDVDNYRDNIKKLFRLISSIDSKLKFYIEEVIKQSQIKKAGRIYAHGISLGRAAEILGISQWALLSYIGKTTISDVPEEIINVRSRLKFARGLFSWNQ